MKYYMKYIIEQNHEMMEECSDIKKTVFRKFDDLIDEQGRSNEEVKRIITSRRFEEEYRVKLDKTKS